MARQRDYAAEYARRVQRERERAIREGRPFSLSKARGHKAAKNPRPTGQQPPALRARALYARNVRQFTKGTMPDWSELKDAVTENGMDWAEIESILQAQADSIDAYQQGNPSPGKDRYDNGQAGIVPIEFFWYHAE